jgi:hypothetical protein
MNEQDFLTTLAALRVRMLREGREIESPETTYRTLVKREGANRAALITQAEALARAVVEADPIGEDAVRRMLAAAVPEPEPEPEPASEPEWAVEVELDEPTPKRHRRRKAS